MYYFETSDGITIYMGKDKYENEELIKYGWPEDVWFHVDDLSSAHVYLRMPTYASPICCTEWLISKSQGMTFETIPETALEECCQLVKENSIKGSKLASVKIVYTPWSNLRKEQRMEVGAIGFHRESAREYRTVSRDRDILKRLGKTKREEYPDLNALRLERDDEERRAKRAANKRQKEEAKRLAAEREQKKKLQSYDSLFDDDFGDFGGGSAVGGGGGGATADATAAREFEDDFM